MTAGAGTTANEQPPDKRRQAGDQEFQAHIALFQKGESAQVRPNTIRLDVARDVLKPILRIRLHVPVGQQQRRVDLRQRHPHFIIVRRLGRELEKHLDRDVQVLPLGQRHEDCLSFSFALTSHLRDRDHPLVVHLGFPKLDSGFQRHFEVGVAAVFQKVLCFGHHLAVVGNLRLELRPVGHLRQCRLPVKRLECLVECEITTRVLVRFQDGRVEQQPVFLRDFRRLESNQIPLRLGLRYLEPLLADQNRVAGLRLHVHRAHAVERQRLALRVELPLEGRQQRVVAEHRGLEVHRVRLSGGIINRLVELPVAHVAADKFHVGVVGRNQHLQLAYRLAADQVVEHRTAVHDPLPDRVKVQRVHVQRQFHPLDAEAGLPAGFLDAISSLQAFDFFWEKDDGNLIHILHRSGNQA